MLEISSLLTVRKWCHQFFKPQALIMMTGTLTCHQMFVIVEVFWPAIEQLFYFVVVTVASKLSLWSKGVDGFLLLSFSDGLDLVLGNWPLWWGLMRAHEACLNLMYTTQRLIRSMWDLEVYFFKSVFSLNLSQKQVISLLSSVFSTVCHQMTALIEKDVLRKKKMY